MINNKIDHRVQFLHSKICTHGNVPWQSQWGGVPREYHSKVHFKVSIRKITRGHILTSKDEAQYGASGVLRPKVPSKLEQNSRCTSFSQE